MRDLDRSDVLHYQQNFLPRTRILLLHMANDPRPIPNKTAGTVQHVDDKGQIHCQFDNGLSHTLVPQIDKFCKLAQQEVGGLQ